MSKAYAKVKMLLGKESKTDPGPDKICKATIRHWCEAMQDANPLYLDEDYAKKSRHKGIVAPPMMVQSCTMSPIWPVVKKTASPLGKAVQLFKEDGYFGIVATTTSFKFFASMKPGDRISQKVKLSSVTPEKKTQLGKGHFVTAEQSYVNQKGKNIAIQMFTILIFKPGK